MPTTYPIRCSVALCPVWHHEAPLVQIGIGNNLTQIDLHEAAVINFDFESNVSCELSVELLNKNDCDSVPDKGLDKAIIIESVSFFGISDPKFAWAGVYEPQYPEPWATEQRKQGVVLKPQLCPHTYLGWNGKWTLTFSVPVFTWIHRMQDLGWIYD